MTGNVVDMIEELQLRRWARLNRRRLTEDQYDSLHVIVLDELRTIENELANAVVSGDLVEEAWAHETMMESRAA